MLCVHEYDKSEPDELMSYEYFRSSTVPGSESNLGGKTNFIELQFLASRHLRGFGRRGDPAGPPCAVA